MRTIAVPDWLPREPEPQVQDAASAVLTDVRAAASAVSDVSEWARTNGAPSDFTGNAAEAADHAVTRFAVDTDAVSTALERGALAIDEFLTQMRQRRTEYADLMERRQLLNDDRDALVQRIETVTDDQIEALQTEAASLRQRFESYYQGLQTWRECVQTDEDAAIRGLNAVDELAEGLAAANSDGRPDTDALREQLGRLGSNTDAVNAWWNGLSEAARNALLISDPDLIGNTNGVPTGDRDEANRSSVQRDIEYLLGLRASGHELSASEQRWLENAQAIEDSIVLADKPPYNALDIDVNVVAYQPQAFGGDGIAAVAYGDPDTADNTAVFVPGIMQDGTTIDDRGADALSLYQESVGNQNGSVATIAWIGYDSPNFNPTSMPAGLLDGGDAAHTLTEANAEAGGHALSSFVDGLNSTHEGGAASSNLTVIGHSYGSTTSAHAAADGLAADNLVLIGSPGAGGGVSDVSGLHMPQGHVYVGAADHDPVTWLGGEIPINMATGFGLGPTHLGNLGLGEDPSQHDFGAHNFAVDSGQTFHGPGGLVTTGFMDNHVSYFEGTNPALANMADIVSGQGDQVADTGGRTQDARDYLDDWVGSEAQHHVVDPIVDGAVQTYEGVRDGAVQTYEGVRDGAVQTYEGVREGANDAIDRGQDAWDSLWPDRWP